MAVQGTAGSQKRLLLASVWVLVLPGPTGTLSFGSSCSHLLGGSRPLLPTMTVHSLHSSEADPVRSSLSILRGTLDSLPLSQVRDI